ncbi:hypothetical protein LSH36_531g00022 [Paralvinella palmiformis]|uniref:Telomerase reverse transcriptase n=1 Tax=Paralvinella palmiformis TaxID=53620 RepID=A0AAD9MYP9_9ANNE|nr:hypothetical protein LSH36_531g00022 [Paralvinella palmiformis]
MHFLILPGFTQSRRTSGVTETTRKPHFQWNCRNLLSFCCLFQIDNSYFLQTRGIIQGSMLSTILCNYYYGAMERDHLRVLGDELLMRQVDDFVFVTPYEENARRFLEAMTKGIQEYNCKINPKKSLTNVTTARDDIVCLPRNG